MRIEARYPLRADDSGDRPADAGDRRADRDRRRVAAAASGASSASRRLGHQRLPVRAGPRPRRARPSACSRRASTKATSTGSSSSSRSRPTTSAARERCYVGTDARINAEHLVEIVEQSMSSPVYELLKRPDELFVVEHAHLQPRFVEDSVRYRAARRRSSAIPTSTTATSSSRARSTSRRSTATTCSPSARHRRRAARRAATGADAPHHTELRDWLSAA